jgi:exodeoxyribonuclease V gamma subunit
MLNLHFANRTETLVDELASRLAAQGRAAAVFAPAQVIAPSAAIRRHLTLALAHRHGVCANVDFSWLASWLWSQIVRLVPGVSPQSPFDPAVLAWRILAAFEDAGWHGAEPRLASYLEHADPVMRYELAARVAGLFDQYLTYRPDWLDAWADGRLVDLGTPDAGPAADQRWQAALWRRLVAQTLGEDRAARQHPAVTMLQALESSGAPSGLPASAHLFCLPAIPPAYLDLLQRLGQHVELHLYALNPCREFWFEVVDRRRLAWLTLRGQADYHEEGNRLLAGWGRQAQSHLGMLVEAAGDALVEDARFVESAGPTLLARLQDAVLDLVDLAPGSAVQAAGDRSIEVHVCHSLTRELEVLHDRLLALFAESRAAGSPLRPGDVLVATPDLDAAAPLIDTVFGSAGRERQLPYTITGRARSEVNAPAHALLDLLALAGSRFAVSEVFGLLQQPAVARRFGLAEDDLARVRAWLMSAGVHWALDASHRASFELPPLARHSFADGLDRLFLGYALPDHLRSPFAGRLPAGQAEGTGALALGAFWRFVDALATLRERLGSPRPPSEWPGLLADALALFIEPEGAELEDLREVHAALETLGEQWARSDAHVPLPLDVVRVALEQALEDDARGGVPTGAITFAAMSSLRNIPFRVVCAIGLDDGAFPTASRPAEFDLLALAPRRGDRQRRLDERNVFLDLLLAARERVHLSYAGRSLRDNAVLPPSVLISELLEYLAPAIAPAGASAGERAQARAHLVVEHPLQPFSEAAFRIDGDPRLRSFHAEYAVALRDSLAATNEELFAYAVPDAAADFDDAALDEDVPPHEPAGPFVATALPPPGPEWHDLPAERLAAFLRNPCRFLLEQRLGIELRREDEQLQDDEPFRPDFSPWSPLVDLLLPPMLDGMTPDEARPLALAVADVPAGGFGRHVLERELQGLHAFAQGVRGFTAEAALEPHAISVDVDVDGATWRVHAGFADLRPRGLLHARYGKIGANDLLRAWLPHLLLCAVAPAGVTPATTLIGRDDTHQRLGPCPDPAAVLATLVRLYARGLREPLAFFPKSSLVCVEGGLDIDKAAREFRPAPSSPGARFAEGADPWIRLALRGRPDPFGPSGEADFIACARAVFDPLRACLAEVAPSERGASSGEAGSTRD